MGGGGVFDGKRALVLGVANKRSIAWAIAQQLADGGARLAFTYQGERIEKSVRDLAATVDTALVTECDVRSDDDVARVFAEVGEAFGGELDILVHSVAFAAAEDLEGRFTDTPRERFWLAVDVSAYSLVACARAAEPLMEKAGGGSIVTMTYLGGERAVPHYNVMGVAKATLDASVKYLAWDLGQKNIRVNAVSAGPVRTLAARSIAGFPTMEAIVEERSPLHRHVDADDVGAAAAYLLGDGAKNVTGHDAVRGQRLPRDGDVMADEKPQEETPAAKADHEPPAAAEISATWTGGATPIDYTARASWLVLRKAEKPAAEIFSVSYVAAGDDASRPVMFVFNGGPGASSAFLHLGVVGPQRVAFPADGTIPELPPRLVQNEASWLAFADLVFVDPVGTGFSRIIDKDAKDGAGEGRRKKSDAADPQEYFGQKRDLESLCEFMSRWLSSNGRWGSPIFIAGESYGGYRVGRLVRMLQESTGIGLNGAILISPALEISTLSPSDYDVLAVGGRAADDGRRRRASRPLPRVRAGHAARRRAGRGRAVRHRRVRDLPHARRLDGRRRSATASSRAGRPDRASGRSRHPRRGTDHHPRVLARAAARRAEGARPLRRDDHGHRPVPRPRLVRRARSDALGDRPRLHDGGQPAAPLRDRRRDRSRVRAPELRGEQGLEGRHRAALLRAADRARPTTSATACR